MPDDLRPTELPTVSATPQNGATEVPDPDLLVPTPEEPIPEDERRQD